jgi:LmbE family N-acetylglucosaminyl deacetylase
MTFFCFLLSLAALARDVHVVTPQEAEAAIEATGKEVVTFVGYSAAEYENDTAMLTNARDVLSHLDPKTALVNIGGSPEGIGHVYELAKKNGF